MICKYCHLNTHTIDKCPTIICKICREVGHPQWLCKEKKDSKIKNNKNILFEKKYVFDDEIKKKKNDSENIIQKNISFYLKLQNENWGDIGLNK